MDAYPEANQGQIEANASARKMLKICPTILLHEELRYVGHTYYAAFFLQLFPLDRYGIAFRESFAPLLPPMVNFRRF